MRMYPEIFPYAPKFGIMSEIGQPLRAIADRRATAAIAAAVIAAALGVGQLWFGQTAGVLAWRGTASTTGTVDEAAIVIWLSAVAVALAAAAPMLLLKIKPPTNRRFLQIGMAVFGACLTVPVATAVAAVSQMYGGDLSQLRVTKLVVFGVALGGLAALISVRSQSAAWSLLYWLAIGWVLMWVSVNAEPAISPMLGHLDPGPEWSASSRQWQARMVLLAVAIAIGMALGAAARLRNWQVHGFAVTARWGSPITVSAGPGLMVAAYLAAAAIDGNVRIDVVVNLVVATVAAAGAAYGGMSLARRASPIPLRTM